MRADALLARYADAPSLLDALHAMDLRERHYRGLAPRAAALAYWDIRPGDRAPPPPEPVPGRGFRSDLARRDEGAARGGGAGGA